SGQDESLWDEEDGFFYDSLHFDDGRHLRLKVRSCVGIVPLFAVETLELGTLTHLPEFTQRMNWFLENRTSLVKNLTCSDTHGACHRRLLAVVDPERLRRVLAKLLDENEFLSPHGIRALSR